MVVTSERSKIIVFICSIIIISLSIFSGCLDNNGNEKLADLTVTGLSIPRVTPEVNEFFTVIVQISNIGEYSSGEYDVVIHAKNITSGSIASLGTFRRSSLEAGATTPFLAKQLSLNLAGPYELSAELLPVGFKEQRDDNNGHTIQIQVNETEP